MSIKLNKDVEKYLLGSIKRFADENLDVEIGDLKAAAFLEFCVREIGPSIYNQAIADAQTYFQDRVSDLEGVCFETEFGYWVDAAKSRRK